MHELKTLEYDSRVDELRDLLQKNEIRVSHQRLLILNYLVLHDTHPSADDIYKDLKAVDPVISQATVYNTLNLLSDKKIIKELDFNMASKRYEFAKDIHGHFICDQCGLIEDFYIDSLDIPDMLADYDIDSQEIIYKGLCPECKEI